MAMWQNKNVGSFFKNYEEFQDGKSSLLNHSRPLNCEVLLNSSRYDTPQVVHS